MLDMGADDPMWSELGDPLEPPPADLVAAVGQWLKHCPHVRLAKLRRRTYRGGALEGVDQLELALLFDEPLAARADLALAKETINELSPRLSPFRVSPTVTGVGGVAMFHRYGALVYERH
jgi:hypothetical protein